MTAPAPSAMRLAARTCWVAAASWTVTPDWRAAITPRVDGHLGDVRPRRPARAAARHRHRGSVHLVAIANRAVTEFRRNWPGLVARRGRKVVPEWAQRNRLLRAAESLTEEESVKLHDAMRAADPSGGLVRTRIRRSSRKGIDVVQAVAAH